MVLGRDSRAAEGDEVVLAWAPENMHVSDRGTGRRWDGVAAAAQATTGSVIAVA